MLFLVRRLPSTLNGIFLTLPVSRSLIAFVARYLSFHIMQLFSLSLWPTNWIQVVFWGILCTFTRYCYCTLDTRISSRPITSRYAMFYRAKGIGMELKMRQHRTPDVFLSLLSENCIFETGRGGEILHFWWMLFFCGIPSTEWMTGRQRPIQSEWARAGTATEPFPKLFKPGSSRVDFQSGCKYTA